VPRVPELVPAQMTAAQRRVHDAIAAGPRGVVEGPLRVWLRSPNFADRAQALGAFCRFGSSLPPQVSELAILVTAAFWRAPFEWYAHAPLALKAGFDPQVVEAIRTGTTPHLPREDQATAYALARELTETHRVSDETYDRAVAALGLPAVVELVGLLGYYTLIAMTINAFEVPLPPGASDPFA
jgi:4-carboxymuconolactone decarboxylase